MCSVLLLLRRGDDARAPTLAGMMHMAALRTQLADEASAPANCFSLSVCAIETAGVVVRSMPAWPALQILWLWQGPEQRMARVLL